MEKRVGEVQGKAPEEDLKSDTVIPLCTYS